MGTYAAHLSHALAALSSPHAFVFYVDEGDESAELLAAGRHSVAAIPKGPLPGRAARVWASVRPPRRDIHAVDVMFSTDLSLAPPSPAPLVGFVHDLIPLSVDAVRPAREWPLSERVLVRTAGRWVYRRGLRRLVDAVHLVTNSEYTRAEVLTHFPEIDPTRISVTHLAADAAFAPCDPQPALNRLEIERPYVLYVGGADPRKNVGALVEGFEAVRRHRADLRLVLVGSEFHDARIARKYRSVFAAIRAASNTGSVVLPGYVDQPTLQALYSGAMCFVMPSLHEGFGIPAVEAMRCGCPVVAGANSAQAEVVGDAGLLVAPDPGSLADAITRVATDDGLRRALQAKGHARAQEFSWERTAERTVAILEEVVHAHPR
jgi:glycosyltransferase involved in cell wall biosynthesis